MTESFWRIWASRYSRLLTQKEVHGKSSSTDKGVGGPGVGRGDMTEEYDLGVQILNAELKQKRAPL
jgi:hypothetical protein